MSGRAISNVKIEGARMIRKNFQGVERQFNEEGDRNFGVLLDDSLAQDLLEEGWNVKFLKPLPDDPSNHKQAWLPVKVKFGKIPPVAMLITAKGKIPLDETTIGQLDWTPADNVDMIIRPYRYPAIRGRAAGVAAYLKAIYVTVMEDDLSEKYADIPMAGSYTAD